MGSLCAECKCDSFTFDDRLGENVCDECGLVHVVRPFEETVTPRTRNGDFTYENTRELGSIILETKSNLKLNQMFRMKNHNTWAKKESDTDIRTMRLCMMILSHYSMKNREHVNSYLRSLNSERVFRGISVENRAAALTYYILKEAGITVSLAKHSEISMVERKYISRYVKRIAKHFRKAHVLSTINSHGIAATILDKLEDVSPNYRMNTLRMIDFLDDYCKSIDVRFTTNRICAMIWAVSVMEDERHHTQELIREASGNCSVIGMRIALKEICGWFDLTKADLFSLSVSDFIHGAYLKWE
tara:strand:- start:2006 stop:2908 length:903 start_codon:yes stop_codon:yes gene_type:complete